MSYSTAVNKITEFVGKLEESFKEDGKVELENIGRFYYAEENFNLNLLKR